MNKSTASGYHWERRILKKSQLSIICPRKINTATSSSQEGVYLSGFPAEERTQPTREQEGGVEGINDSNLLTSSTSA